MATLFRAAFFGWTVVVVSNVSKYFGDAGWRWIFFGEGVWGGKCAICLVLGWVGGEEQVR